MENLPNILGDFLAVPTGSRVLASVALVTLALILKYIVGSVIKRRIKGIHVQVQWRQISGYAIGFVSFLILISIWFDGVEGLFTVLTLVAAALTITMKEFIQNFASWSVIVSRELFSIGDRIKIGSRSGEVIDIGPLYFTLSETDTGKQGSRLTGRTIKVPNGTVIQNPVINNSGGLNMAWNEIDLFLSLESDIDQARMVFQDVIQREAEKHPINGKKTIGAGVPIKWERYIPNVQVRVEDGKVVLTGRYLCDPSKQRWSTSAVWTELVSRLRTLSEIEIM